MPREIPPPPGRLPYRSGRDRERSLTIRLLTPLFGGGVMAGQPDGTLPVRGSSIRGQLQFWWRATVGASFPNWREMRRRHGEVWGQAADKKDRTETANRSSAVQVTVRELGFARPTIYSRHSFESGTGRDRRNNRRGLSYALFPFDEREKRDDRRGPASFIESGSFHLRLRYPGEFEWDVDQAITAWIRFGGIGARTRRGCGSLHSSDVLFAPDNPFAGIEVAAHSSTREWPTLSTDLLIGKEQASWDAWNAAVEVLRDFRQMPGFARDRGEKGPARSRFPEPDTIRRLTRRSSKGHSPRDTIPDGYFPRAAFGMPIIFHFKNEKENDPPDTTLLPIPAGCSEPTERMASPIITKAVAIDEGRAIPMLLKLRTVPPAELSLRDRAKRELGKFSASRVFVPPPPYENSPLAASKDGSAIEALFRYAEDVKEFRSPTR